MNTSELASTYVATVEYLLQTPAPLPHDSVKNCLISMVMHALDATKENLELKRRIAALEIQVTALQREKATVQ